jgi:hypothetical protein
MPRPDDRTGSKKLASPRAGSPFIGNALIQAIFQGNARAAPALDLAESDIPVGI